MADDPNDDDPTFLEFLGRLSPTCKPLAELIDQRIQEALKATNPALSGAPGLASYLERQNQMLLDRVLKIEMGRSTLAPPGDQNPPDPSPPRNEGENPTQNEPPKPQKPPARKPFFR